MTATELTPLDLGQRLAAWRRANNLSLRDVSATTDIPVRTLENIEQGRGFRYPRLLLLAMQGGRANV